mmetsp:Transcript_17239/g.21209  ORF Transcript_17239/g.21209 Transcript_17239/m.21209 type:complete len:90 (-) Transcript_17239:53-322(-)
MTDLVYTEGSYVYINPNRDLEIYCDIIRPGKQIIIKCDTLTIKTGVTLKAHSIDIVVEEPLKMEGHVSFQAEEFSINKKMIVYKGNLVK